ncbi:MAG TPA: hypothetical protein VKF40_03325 [Burkholderiales bacterium]|nr:hypothetical protein [Burkholderiales bacterium]
MAAADDQLVPVELDLVHQQAQVGLAEARRRIVEAFLEGRAEGIDLIGVHPAHGERLAIRE